MMSDPTPVGMAAFDSLRAENEPWLFRAFVQPLDEQDYEHVVGEQSALIFGETGSGKTTLSQTLRALSTGSDGYPVRLIVDWNPRLAVDAPAPAAEIAIADQLNDLFDKTALTAAHHLGQHPERWQALPDWAQNTLIWFVQQFLRGDRVVRLNRLKENSPPRAAVLLDRLSSGTVRPVLNDSSYRYDDVIAELAKALEALGLQGIWVISDELDRYQRHREPLAVMLADFLSTLGIFERPRQMAFKVFLPAPVKFDLKKLVDFRQYHRFKLVTLKWTLRRLQTMVEQRLFLASGDKGLKIASLCDDPKLMEWLERACGTNPREWLYQVRPLAAHYLSDSCCEPLNKQDCLALFRQYPPSLHINAAERRIFISDREILLDEFPKIGFEILCYLYEHAERTVSKAELFYRVYRQLPSVPRSPGDDDYEAPTAYANNIDNLILKVRRVIEPESSDPILIMTVRGEGLRLNLRV